MTIVRCDRCGKQLSPEESHCRITSEAVGTANRVVNDLCLKCFGILGDAHKHAMETTPDFKIMGIGSQGGGR